METENTSETQSEAVEAKRLSVSKKVYASYEMVKVQLKERGVKEYSFQKYLDGVLEKTTDKTFTDIVDENTPDEYRIQEALKDPALRQRLLNEVKKAKSK